MTAQIYSMNGGAQMAYQMGNRRAIIARTGGEVRYNVRDNAKSEWRHAISGPHVKTHIEKVKAAVNA